MKQFLRSFKVYNFLLIALVIRLFFLPLTFHSDLTTNSIWGIYANEFGLRGYYDWLSFGNYARPEYPPFSTVLFMILRIVYEGLFNIFWKVNSFFPVFPSEIITWIDKYGYMGILKVPAIVADLGIGYAIYKLTKKKILAGFYLFNPAVIYLSAIWGQTESVVGLLGLGSLIYLTVNRYVLSFWSIFASLMVKATMLPLTFILVLESARKKIRIKSVLLIAGGFLLSAYLIGYFFIDHDFINWTVNSFIYKFMTGAHSQQFINLNAFNLWGLMFGQTRVVAQPYMVISYVVTGIFLIPVIVKYLKSKDKDVFFLALIVFYTVFLFMPKMHERYLYPVFVFFPLVLWGRPKLKKVFYLVSGIFLLNLMSGWTIAVVPEALFRGLAAANLGVFSYLLWKYLS